MKILVLSDSHGSYENVRRAVEIVKPGMVFHLGDGWRDAERLQEELPDLPLEHVPGNCDFRSHEPAERLLEVGGMRILLCHGHTYHVKYTMSEAEEAAKRMGLDLFLFGHTHTPLIDRKGRTMFMNPGSVGTFRPTYGIVSIANGKLDGRIVVLPWASRR